MFASRHRVQSLRHHLYFVNSAPSALKSPHHTSAYRRDANKTQLLPPFSTPSKHGSHTISRNSFPFYALLHTSRHTSGEGYPGASSIPNPRQESPSQPITTPLNATLTNPPADAHSKALTAKLNPLDPTFTKNKGGISPSSCICSFFRCLHTSLLPSLNFATLCL
jgi:hypothetical protein